MKITKKTPVKEVLELGKDCKVCGFCCTNGSGIVLNREIPAIASFLGIKEKNLIEKYLEPIEKFHTVKNRIKMNRAKDRPHGVCILYSPENKNCRIHTVKPLYCKVCNCSEHGEELLQWFNLNFFVNPNDPQSIREWKIFCDFNKTIEGGSAEELVGKKLLFEILTYKDLSFETPEPVMKVKPEETKNKIKKNKTQKKRK